MAEKQDRLRAEREAERQAKLKSAERMAGLFRWPLLCLAGLRVCL